MKNQFVFGLLLGVCLTTVTLNPLLSVISNNSKLIEHTLNNQLVVSTPNTTKIIENNITEKGQLLRSVYLDDQALFLRGYIQLWNISNLENYLVDSQEMSTFDFLSYSLKPIKVAGFDGYLTEWTESLGLDYKILGTEYWLRKSNTTEVLRISFFADSTSFTKDQNEYINKIIDSIKWNN